MTPDRRLFLGTSAVALSAGLTQASHSQDPAKPGQTKNTKFAVNVEMWWSKERDFLKRLEAAATLGFPAVEFWPFENKNIPAIAENCERLGLEVAQFTAWGFKPGLNEAKNHPQFVEKIEKGCEVAKQLKCRMMTVVAGDDVPGVSQEKMHDTVIEGLRKAAPIAERHGITLILEPMNIRVDHKGHCLYGSAPAIKIIKAVNSPAVKLNWDLYHMQITEGDLCGHLREGFSANAIGYVQLADHPGRNEPGTGEIHYPRVFKELHALKYTGFVGLECRPRNDELSAARAIFAADTW